MQAPRADALTNFESEQLRASLRDIVDDSELLVSVTYKRLGSGSYDPEAGVNTVTDDEDTLNALRGTVTLEEVERSGGLIQVGDRKYKLDDADLTTSPPTVEDQITDGSDTFEVVDVKTDPRGWFHTVIARAV